MPQALKPLCLIHMREGTVDRVANRRYGFVQIADFESRSDLGGSGGFVGGTTARPGFNDGGSDLGGSGGFGGNNPGGSGGFDGNSGGGGSRPDFNDGG